MKAQSKGSPTPVRPAAETITSNLTRTDFFEQVAEYVALFKWAGRGLTSTLTSVQLALNKTAGSTGQLRLQVWTENSSHPGTLVAQSQPINLAEITTGDSAPGTLLTFAFAPVTPIPGTHWLVLKWSPNNVGGGHEVQIVTEGSGSQAYWHSSDGAAWTSDGNDALPYVLALGVIG